MFILFLYLIRECWNHQALINFFLSRMLNTQSLCKVEFNSLMQLTTRHVDCKGNCNYMHIIILLQYSTLNNHARFFGAWKNNSCS